MIIDDLKTIVDRERDVDRLFVRNLLKESLQLYVLNFIYSSSWGKRLIFKGGSCLRHFFDLPRLSEDLDFDIDSKDFNSSDFLLEIRDHFIKTWQYRDFDLSMSGKEQSIKLKFPVLEELGLAGKGESNILFLRIDLVRMKNFDKYKVENDVKSTVNFSFLARRYALPDLFSGKIAAILSRGRIKGRDYFDLSWFLEKKVRPNMESLEQLTGIKSLQDLREVLKSKVVELDLTVLKEDLNFLFRDKGFVATFSSGYKEMVLRMIDQSL
ncbi:MAG: nucleotidyl transferase AbiEii/AbiGii toxin family protein [Patescibacteria group bacterium]